MANNDKPLSDTKLAEMLHRAGVRPSVQRIAILSYVANSHSHPAADEVYTRLASDFPSLSLTTVYNALHILTDAGLLRELDIESERKRYDLAPQPPHSHFICRECGRVFDMMLPMGLDAKPNDSGFSIESVDVYYKGLCPKCKNKQLLSK